MSNISFHVTNLNTRDANFLSSVITLFTDPANDEQAQLVRTGKQLICVSPIDGSAILCDPSGIPGAAQIRRNSAKALGRGTASLLAHCVRTERQGHFESKLRS
jgi:hypothetical protein